MYQPRMKDMDPICIGFSLENLKINWVYWHFTLHIHIINKLFLIFLYKQLISIISQEKAHSDNKPTKKRATGTSLPFLLQPPLTCTHFLSYTMYLFFTQEKYHVLFVYLHVFYVSFCQMESFINILVCVIFISLCL